MNKTVLHNTQKPDIAKISVIMPVYNTPRDFLQKAIESLLTQTYTNFELFVIDDASTTDILSIVSAYKDKRIKYMRLSQNRGAASARNLGIDKATGEYIAFLDSDDIAEQERFEKQVKYLSHHKNVGCLASCVEIISNLKKHPNFPYLVTDNEIKNYLLFQGCAFCQSSVMLRHKILQQNNLKYDDYFVPAEDYKLWLDLISFTKFAILPDKLVQYRFYNENISNRQKKMQNTKCIEAQFKAVIKHYNLDWEKISEIQKFLIDNTYQQINYQKVLDGIKYALSTLEAHNISSEYLKNMFKIRYKKHCYHTRSLKGQFQLLKASIYRQLELPLYWQIFCFITRGIL